MFVLIGNRSLPVAAPGSQSAGCDFLVPALFPSTLRERGVFRLQLCPSPGLLEDTPLTQGARNSCRICAGIVYRGTYGRGSEAANDARIVLMRLPLLLALAAASCSSPPPESVPVGDKNTFAQAADGTYINWEEHLIDDEAGKLDISRPMRTAGIPSVVRRGRTRRRLSLEGDEAVGVDRFDFNRRLARRDGACEKAHLLEHGFRRAARGKTPRFRPREASAWPAARRLNLASPGISSKPQKTLLSFSSRSPRGVPASLPLIAIDKLNAPT